MFSKQLRRIVGTIIDSKKIIPKNKQYINASSRIYLLMERLADSLSRHYATVKSAYAFVQAMYQILTQKFHSAIHYIKGQNLELLFEIL